MLPRPMFEKKATAKFESIEHEIKRILRSASKEVLICVAWISYKQYGDIICDLVRRGVVVTVICHDSNANEEFIAKLHGIIKIYPIRSSVHSALMHNKFCIVDGRVLINGSYNWSAKAPWHFENIVVTENDFELIKQFLHEFYDLVNYYMHGVSDKYSYCRKCRLPRARAFNLGILGDETSIYRESLVDIWNVCPLHWHAVHLASQSEPFLLSRLGLNEEDDHERMECVDPDTMYDEFNYERNESARIERFFDTSFNTRIDAVGSVQVINPHEHLEWGDDQERSIRIIWKRFSVRKVIPDTIYENSDDIGDIIMRHK